MTHTNQDNPHAAQIDTDPDDPPSIRLDQFKTIYDYIKFHIGLYLATPPALVIVADAFKFKDLNWFHIGLALMLVIYAISGVHAGWFMGKYIHRRWTKDFPSRGDLNYFLSRRRRIWHHYLYWLGILVGLMGLAIAGYKSYDWTSYPILDITEAPEEVDIVLLNRHELPPAGAGESSIRPVAAALANAAFDATVVRLRRAPLTAVRLKPALA